MTSQRLFAETDVVAEESRPVSDCPMNDPIQQPSVECHKVVNTLEVALHSSAGEVEDVNSLPDESDIEISANCEEFLRRTDEAKRNRAAVGIEGWSSDCLPNSTDMQGAEAWVTNALAAAQFAEQFSVAVSTEVVLTELHDDLWLFIRHFQRQGVLDDFGKKPDAPATPRDLTDELLRFQAVFEQAKSEQLVKGKTPCKGTIDQRMAVKLQKDPDSAWWTTQQWQAFLNCKSRSGIVTTSTWKTLKTLKANEAANRLEKGEKTDRRQRARKSS